MIKYKMPIPNIKNYIKTSCSKLVCILCMLCLCGCSTVPGLLVPEEASPPPSPPRELLRLAMPSNADTFHPLYANSSGMMDVLWLVFESLLTTDETGKLTACLASTWSCAPSGNQTVWSLSLRKGVTWHDGSPFTADDVVYSFDQIKQGQMNVNTGGVFRNVLSAYRQNLDAVLSYRKVDENTFEFTTQYADYGALYQLDFPIVKANSFSSEQAQTNAPIGTGGYRVTSAQLNVAMQLEANQNWWKVQPTIRSVSVTAMESPSAVMQAFILREIDALTSDLTTVSDLRASSDAKMTDYLTRQYVFIAPNCANAVLSNVNVRKALQMGMDKTTIITQVYQNHAIAVDSPLYPFSYLHASQNVVVGSAAEISALLADAGWNLRDGNGIYYYIDDQHRKIELAFTLLVNENRFDTARQEVARMLVAQWAKIGIKVELSLASWEDYQKAINEKTFDLVLGSYQLSNALDIDFAFSSGSQKNINGVSSAGLDAQLTALRNAASEESYFATWQALEREILDYVPYISLFYLRNTLVVSNDLHYTLPAEKQAYRNVALWRFE